MKKIGILGGTFDPIHIGHLTMAEAAYSEFSLDEVWIMPTGESPHKGKKQITDIKNRCEMIELAIEDNEHFKLSTFEVEQQEVNYTYITLQKLNEKYPECEFFFIMGEDSLKYFEHWKKPDIIADNATLLVAVRDDLNEEELDNLVERMKMLYDAKIFKLHSPNISVSSRQLRNDIKEGKTVKYLLPDKVIEYIKKNSLYQ